MRGGIIARRSVQDLTGKDFLRVNPRNIEIWKFHIREATRQSFWLAKFMLISMISLFAGIKIFLCVFIPTCLIATYIFYRIWRTPNDYQKELGITKEDIRSARKKL
jgi:hypothetical protein